MPREFNIPSLYRSDMVRKIKNKRLEQDPRKKDLSPSEIKIGSIVFKLARHFGFCFGVENAIEIAYRAVEENPNKRVFLLSEMIHNQHVNRDLLDRGVRFLMDTGGKQLIPFEELQSDDIVIVPAFGTTLEMFERIEQRGVKARRYNATCPFVEKVWRRSQELGSQGFSIVIHGKHKHEETRATFSHASSAAPSIVIADIHEAKKLAPFLCGRGSAEAFFELFEGRFSVGFDPQSSLQRIGVVNQTTMLAGETRAIAEYLRDSMREIVGAELLDQHFADTKDTLCYATSENQGATSALIEAGGDLALVVGGYNSSNTSHLAELCQEHMPTFLIKDHNEILSAKELRHLDLHSIAHGSGRTIVTSDWLPLSSARPIEILLTAGASCPDRLVEEVIERVVEVSEMR
jgi:4-hydroxy-3-methylbut-2-en-1-yl diphosphate reductase